MNAMAAAQRMTADEYLAQPFDETLLPGFALPLRTLFAA
jgi:hypothetical protein